MSEGEERKHQRLGLLSSIGIHVAMLLLFLFVMGWKAPNPPLSEIGSGIELNFGLDDQGGGDIQPEKPVGTSEVVPEEKVVEDTPKQEEKPQEESKPDTKAVEKPLTSEDESPVTVKEKEVKKETKVTKEDKPKEIKTKVVVPETKKEEKKTVKDPEPVKPVEEKKGAPGPSQGDDKGKKGDKGSPQGTLDAKALYGKPGNGGGGDGGGGGGGISMTGFAGFDRPEITAPEIPNESYGTYTFIVTVGKDGEIISIKPKEMGTSTEAMQIFKETIEKLEFTAAKNSNAAISEGTITFRVVPPKSK